MERIGPSLRRTRRRERPGWRVLAALAISLALNLLAVTTLDPGLLGLGRIKEVRPVEMAPLAASAWEANRAIRPAPAVAPAPPSPPPREPALAERGQVVDLGPATAAQDKQPPRDARFLAERNSAVEKETRSRHARAGYENPLPVPASPAPGAASGQDGRSDRAVAGREGEKRAAERAEERLALAVPAPAARAPSTAGDLPGPADSPAQAPRAAAEPVPPAAGGDGEGGQRLRGRLDPRLTLPAETVARLSGGPAPDYLRDVEEGEGTFLNAREFKFATYMNQVKRAIVRTWHPDKAYLKRDPDGTLFPARERYTLLAVTLDESGRMKDATVERRSGLDFLDQAAVDAIREAQPFLNPPHAMVENGEVKFTFGFIFTMSADRPRVQVFRPPTPY